MLQELHTILAGIKYLTANLTNRKGISFLYLQTSKEASGKPTVVEKMTKPQKSGDRPLPEFMDLSITDQAPASVSVTKGKSII